MRDIVERLNSSAGVRSDGDAKTMIDAAAEIERLRAALEYADKQLRGYGQIDPLIRKVLSDEQAATPYDDAMAREHGPDLTREK